MSKPWSEERRAAHGARMRALWADPEKRANRKPRGKSKKPMSQETRDKISASKTGVGRAPFTPEHIQHMRDAWVFRKKRGEVPFSSPTAQAGVAAWHERSAAGLALTPKPKSVPILDEEEVEE